MYLIFKYEGKYPPDVWVAAGSRKMRLAYIDLDHVKAFNDRYGFIRGDTYVGRDPAACL